jgi:hypothetical protein
MHRRIYQAIRARDPKGARKAMNEHLIHSSFYQEQEAAGERSGKAATAAAAAPSQAGAKAARTGRGRRHAR